MMPRYTYTPTPVVLPLAHPGMHNVHIHHRPCTQEQTTTPIFGSASTFGAGGGFAGFTGAPAAKAGDVDGDAGDGDDAAPEEECKAEFKPIVQLDEVETTTGEEEENLVADLYVISWLCIG